MRALAGARGLLRDPVWHSADPGEGRGVGVLLVPGFGFPDWSLALTSSWLAARGYRPVGSRIGFNLGCTTDLVDRLARGLTRHAAETGGKVILLGQSRGGWLARLVASRLPGLVRGLIMFGTPVLDPLGAKPEAVRTARMLTRLSALGLPGLLSEDCFTGRCFRTSKAALDAPLPSGIQAVSVYSKTDGVVPWQLCLDPYADWTEIQSNHVGMGVAPAFYRAIAPRLAGWAAA
ncbi:alpha/beta fold hydrolase [Kibdelosporangium philippinense]|uniref:Alpha/beta fold hydrolase n=1 Tax=Kibdelosporangium philippinense TaxID=211113 RepID=A0ABS8ZVY3_9PSEU|nr:alpha/beta fold hydrolase [Kibdelosporangium philippinense]MCE7011858.1 alpha/beta fold hydrolase [Kibdelosporangium philippinense]